MTGKKEEENILINDLELELEILLDLLNGWKNRQENNYFN